MPMCWVSLSADLCIVSSILNPHQQISTATGIPIPPYGAWDLEAITNMYWPPGVAVSKNKFTSNVKHKNLCIVKEGHDLGPLLIHVPIPGAPDDFMFAIHTLKSARKVNFAAGMVQADGDPIACAWFPIFPMTGCAEPINLPTATPPTCALNTVIVNMHWIDVLAGWVQIAADAIVDAIKNAMGGGNSPTSFTGALTEAVAGDALDPRKWALEQVGGNAGGIVRVLGRTFCDDYHGPASLSLGMSQGMAASTGIELKVSDDGWQVTGSWGVAGGLGSASANVASPSDGSAPTAGGGVTAVGFNAGWTDSSGPTGGQSWL